MKKKLKGIISLLGFALLLSRAQAQVDVTATSGTLNASYVNLSSAFAAINGGTHGGDILIEVSSSFTDVGSAVLNSTGVGSASYSSLLLRPSADGVTISFASTGGRGVVELNGADNVTIDGDNPNTGGINRNLTILNSAANTVTYTSVIRIATGTGNTTADNVTVRNINLLGNATGRNLSSATSTTGSENTTFGIIVGPNGGASVTSITSVTGAMGAGNTVNDFLIDNCTINQCARGIAFIGNTAASSNGVTITNNLIGEQSVTQTPSGYPFTSPSSTVYTKGIYIQGTNAITISGNTLKNIISYVGTPINAIELNSAIGSGSIQILNNIINGVALNVAAANATRGISIANAGAPFIVRGNTITNVQNSCSSTTTTNRPFGLFIATSASSAIVENNMISTIYNRNTGTYGVSGVFLNGGNNISFVNNFISDVNQNISGGAAFSAQYGVLGLTINAGTGHKVYYNTISLSGAMFGTNTTNILSAALAISGTGQTGVDVRNNIFSNVMTGGTTSVAHASIYLPSGATSAMDLTLNNNFYYSGTDAARQGIAQAGTTAGTGFYLASNFNSGLTSPAANLRSYTSTLNASGLNDNASGASSVNAPFLSASDLHINTFATNVSDLDAKGAVISGITLDIDGDTRNVSTPDIGADEFLPSNLCSGAPAASNAVALPTSVCSGVNFNLSLDVTYTEAGYTYQWESSSDNISYSPISGATNATLSTTQTVVTYYHCIITCTTSGMSTTSSSIQVNMNLPTACYCTPAFSNGVEPITLVNFVGINNSTSPTVNGTPALEDFTAMTANVTQGMSYPITLKGNTDGNFTNYMNVFIDFNQNGSFADAGESFNIGTITNSTGIDAVQATGNITIPFTSTAGITRMRVMKLFSGYSASCNTTGFGQAEDYTIDITAAINCTGTPTAGSISTASLNVCSGTNVTLNLTGQSTDANITIQWESSPDGITYTPISGANGTSYSTTISAVTYFQCVVTCTSSGQSSTTAPVQFSINPFTACYCTPTFSNAVEPITLVNFAGINNSTSPTVNGTPALEDFTAMTANVIQGSTYPVTLKGNTDGNFTNYMNVFIDFNQNGSFADAGESFNIGTIINSTGIDAVQATGNITIPFTSTPGVTRMRVMKLFSGYSASCNTTGFGQAEDYSIDITAAVNCTGTPTAGSISTASLNVCSGSSVTLDLTGQSTDANITIQWESSPDGVTYTPISGANGNSYTTTISTATYFQCVVTCTSSGLSATTTPVQFNINPFTSCYCAVTFPGNVEPITLVNFAGINNTTSNVLNGTPAQENFTSITASVNKGQSYPITLKGNTDGNFTTYLTVYIDLNQNGSYTDLGENFEIGTITNSTGIDAIQLTGNIAIPMSATTGITGMRVIKKFNSIATPCNAAGYGQAEDYTIDIQPCVPPSSVVLVSGDADAIICPNTSVTFTAPSGMSYYDFQLNGSSVQAGASNTYTNLTLAVNDVVNVIAGYDATCATTSNSFTFGHHDVPVANVVGTDALCNGVANGSANLTVTGGTPSFTYVWSNGTFNEDLAAVAAGTYTVAVIDANGCSGNGSVTISQPSDFSVSVSTTNVTCFSLNDGSIDLTVTGATPPYTFDWDNDGTGDNDDTEDLSLLTAGVYTGVVTDANGCTDGGSITITEPALLEATAVVDHISCFSLNDGSIDITVTGGTSPYTFDWDNDGTGDNDDTEDLTALSSGSYDLVVTDANGCTAVSSSTITEPAVLATSVTTSNISCNGLTDGSLDVTITGGTSPFTFDWDNDGTGDSDDTEDINGLAAGTYNVIIVDANGCGSVSGGSITEPTAFNVSVSTNDASCFGLSDGSIDLTVSGATPPYTFDWDNDGTGDNDDTEDLSGLSAGVYAGVVTDANGCTEGGNVTINEPTEIVASIVADDISCFGNTDGSLDMTITGGSGIYTIDWDNDGTGDNDDTEDLSALIAGTYTVVVTDNTNCSVTNSATIVEPGVISTSVTATDISCFGLTDGSVDLTISGGTSPFTIDWDNDGTGDNDDNEDLTGLGAGTFTVSVNDANGCPASSSNATINEPAAIAISSTITNANCDNSSDGAIDLTVSGGTGALDFSWTNSATTEDISGLADGNYTVTVTDDNGCVETSTETVGFDNVSPTVSLTITPSVACNTESGITLGGESPAGGNWSGAGVIGSTFDPSTAGIGTHTIVYTFTDGNGCAGSAQDDIQVDDCSGISEEEQNNFLVYPNPTTGMFTISTLTESGNIIIRDAIGKVVYSNAFTSSKISMDLTSMARGVYYITLETTEGTMIQKLVKN